MTYILSKRSLGNLKGVQPALVAVVHRAIELTTIDFAVIEGRRTLARQRELVETGASQTLASKHLTGHAVDLMAYMGNRGSWELPLYDAIAEAMRNAAKEQGAAIRWGGAWTVPDITRWGGAMHSAMQSYIDTRRILNKRAFIDAPHFELS